MGEHFETEIQPPQGGRNMLLLQTKPTEIDEGWVISVASIRPAPNVQEQRQIWLSDWRVIQIDDDHRILVGLLPCRQTMRYTTTLKIIDPIDRTWITESGRQYFTVGAPSEDQELIAALKVFSLVCGLLGEPTDITGEFWPHMQSSVH